MAASRGSTSSRKPGLLRRSGLTSSTSTSPAADRRVDLLPVVGVGGVDGVGPDAGALGGRDLVAHQGQQGRDDHGRARARVTQQQRRHEVDRGLPPPGALHHQRPPALHDQGLDGRPLVVAQPGVVAADERPEVALRLGADVGLGGGHPHCLAAPPDHAVRSSTAVVARRRPRAPSTHDRPTTDPRRRWLRTAVEARLETRGPTARPTRPAGRPSPRRTTRGPRRGAARAGSGRRPRPAVRAGCRGSP